MFAMWFDHEIWCARSHHEVYWKASVGFTFPSIYL